MRNTVCIDSLFLHLGSRQMELERLLGIPEDEFQLVSEESISD